MARSLNKVMLIGHLGADPELRYTPSGVPVATFRIATNEVWKTAEGKIQERTEWHNIVVWRRLAEISNDLLKKGSRVYVEGRLQTRTYEDRNGIRRSVTEIVADDIIVLEPKPQPQVEETVAEEAADIPIDEIEKVPPEQTEEKPGEGEKPPENDLPF